MARSQQELVAALVAQLDPGERDGAVVYYAEPLVADGEPLAVPGVEAQAPFRALLGFVDREPTANWTHSCRYVLVNRDIEEVVSIEAQLPPFGPTGHRQWRVAYKAPSVPDAAVAVSM